MSIRDRVDRALVGVLLWLSLTACGGAPPTTDAAAPVEDDFSAARCLFGSLEGTTSRGYGCVDGEFRAWIDNDQNPYDFITAPQGQDYADVQLQVDVLIHATEQVPFGGAVFVCRGAQVYGFYYAFVLAPDGTAQVSDYLNGEEQVSRFGSASPGTFKPDDWNHVRIDCVGTNMALYLNGELVVDRVMDSFERGDIGLGAGGASDGFTEVRFRNLVVSVP